MSSIALENNKGGYIPSLDGIRGAGVIVVVSTHCFSFIKGINLGWISMDFFFVLSGYLITGILINSIESRNYFKNYLARRVLRVFPLYYAFLIIMFFIIPLLFPHILKDYQYLQNNQIWFWCYCQNWLFSIKGFPIKSYLNHLWSMAVEEQFYLFWPLIVWICRGKKLLLFCFVGIIFSTWFRLYGGAKWGLIYPYPYVNTIARMDSLLIGASVFLMARYYKKTLEIITFPILIFSVLGFITCIIILKAAFFGSLIPAYNFVDLMAGSVLTFCLSKDMNPIKKFFSKSILIYLGKYSYAIYIFHAPIQLVLEENFAHDGNIMKLALVGIVTVIVSFILALLSFKYLESPFLGLKKYF